MRRFCVMAALGVACWSSGFFVARGDDFLPPPWQRLGQANLSTSAEWEFLTPSNNPAFPDGQTVPLHVGDGGVTNIQAVIGANLQWDAYDGDGGWIPTGLDPGEIVFECPNWIDLKPIKWLRIQITHSGGQSPFVADVVGIDPQGAASQFVSANDVDAFHRLEIWQIFPNPNHERIRLVVPNDVLIDQVVIDAISIPEPASWLLALCGAACAWWGRRRR